MKSVLIVFNFFLVGLFTIQAQYIDLNEVPVSMEIGKESSLVVLGKTNVNQFECNYNGKFYKQDRIRFKKQRKNNTVKLRDFELEVVVKSVDCKKKIYNNNMYDLLQAEQHPTIDIDLTKLTIYEDSTSSKEQGVGYFDVVVTIAGVKNKSKIVLSHAEKTEEAIRFIGDIELLMTDYNLEPPSKMGGMIKVKEELLISVELVLLQ